MRALFLAILVVLSLASLAMKASQPRLVPDGKIGLVYSTDDNPVRDEQTGLFEKLNPDLRVAIDPGNTDLAKVICSPSGASAPTSSTRTEPRTSTR